MLSDREQDRFAVSMAAWRILVVVLTAVVVLLLSELFASKAQAQQNNPSVDAPGSNHVSPVMERIMADVNLPESVEYREISGFLGYRVGSDGTAWSRRKRGPGDELADGWKQLKPLPSRGGYQRVALWSGGRVKYFAVHVLVMGAFVGPRPAGMHCCHDNGMRTDNRLANLRYDTPAGNNADKIKHGTHQAGEKNGHSKLNSVAVAVIRKMRRIGYLPREIAWVLDVNKTTVERANRGETWSIV